MQPLVLLIGYLLASISLALGYNVLPAIFVLATAVVIVWCRAYDEAQRRE